MTNQDLFALSLLSVCLMKQHATLEDMNSMLNCLTERMDSVSDRNQCTNLTLGMLTVCLMHQKEALGQVRAMVRDLTDRVDSMGCLERQMGRIHREEGSPAQRDATKTRYLVRLKPSPRKRESKKA